MITDRKGRRVADSAGPGHGGPWPLARPALPHSIASMYREDGHDTDARALCLAPAWRTDADGGGRLSFHGDHWRCSFGRRRATGAEALDAFTAAYMAAPHPDDPPQDGESEWLDSFRRLLRGERYGFPMERR